jgi:hypothetical protein
MSETTVPKLVLGLKVLGVLIVDIELDYYEYSPRNTATIPGEKFATVGWI